jgi:hypothetical protein
MNKRILDAELRRRRGFLYLFPRYSAPSASYHAFSDMLLELTRHLFKLPGCKPVNYPFRDTPGSCYNVDKNLTCIVRR